MSEPRSVIVASADPLFAQTASAYLERQPGWRAVATAADGLQCLAAVGRHRPRAVLVLGDHLPRLNARPLAAEIRRRWPTTTVAILSDGPGEPPTTLPHDADGGASLEALASEAGGQGPEPEPAPPEGVERLRNLTRRERQILTLLVSGLSRSEIGDRLGISGHTVRTHLQNLYAKLDCHSRLDVLRFAAELGLVGTGGQPAPTS